MKTAISIPDEIFKAAERVAKRLGISRSELYARAVRAFVDEVKQDRITDRLNDVYADEDSTLDPILAGMQAASIDDGGW